MRDLTRFLEALHPAGPYHIYALKDGRVHAHTFSLAEEAAETAQEATDDGWNVYGQLSELSVRFNRENRTSKGEHVVASRFVWVDIDIESGVPDLNAIKKSIVAQVTASGVPLPPFAIIDSGHGLWFIWRIERTKDLAAVEAANRGIVKTIGGEKDVWAADNAACDRSRIFRLPFTKNWPTQKKIDAGRSPEPLPTGLIDLGVR